jgi:transcriptional regulator with XRE-family HTH domain
MLAPNLLLIVEPQAWQGNHMAERVTKKRGPKPNLERRRQVAALRARDMTLQQIGKCLGISRQAVQQLLARAARRWRAAGVPCAECGAQVAPEGGAGGTRGTTLCPECLTGHPEAGFALRLRALRIAAGLTLTGLAERAGVSIVAIHAYEHGRRQPKPRSRAKLVRVLGPGLVPTDGQGR